MTFDQPAIDFDTVAEPITGNTLATVDLVGRDWRAERDWSRFEAVCREVADADRVVDPNRVRELLGGSIESRRLSAFWCRATNRNGFMDNHGWTTNTDTAGRNNGKPLRTRRLRT